VALVRASSGCIVRQNKANYPVIIGAEPGYIKNDSRARGSPLTLNGLNLRAQHFTNIAQQERNNEEHERNNKED
jgi:hypothetical protein